MVTLVILDGFGLRKEKFGNAIAAAGTPNLDKLLKLYPHTQIEASGEAVGLPKGQVGNSEVGHLTIGAGRMLPQDLLKINLEIENGKFYQNPALLKALDYAEKSGTLHITGLLSDAGVHGHIQHLYAILRAAKQRKLNHIYIHVITDGRDTPATSGTKYIAQLEDFIKENHIDNAEIASISGRVYPMDREKRFDRLQKFYDMVTLGEPCVNMTAQEAIHASYDKGVTDEFVIPVLLKKEATIKNGESVILYNYRSDRGIEITDAFTSPDFKEFETRLSGVMFTPMMEYASRFHSLNIFYPQIEVKDNLSAILTKAGIKHFHIAEQTKYAHVTFYFNGMIDKPYEGEDRKIFESIDAQDFSYYPKMRALEITEATLEAIASNKYGFIIVNYSNPDMLGHTGNFNATKETITCVEKQAYALALATLMAGGDCIITADHGNAEEMFDKKGNKITSHTANPVPFILVSERFKHVKLKKGGTLANIAPTILKLLNLPIPDTMTTPLF